MQIEQAFEEYILENPIRAKESALKTSMEIQNSELNLGGGYYTRTLLIPKFFTQEDRQIFEKIVQSTFSIFETVFHAYRNDPEIRALFPFDKELEELILLEPLYAPIIPISRIDIFYNEETKDYWFCEFNSDGTSAMNENRRLHEFLKYNEPYQVLHPDVEEMELMDSWIDAFLEDYAQSPKAQEAPVIAITDFLEKAYLTELYVFRDFFEKRGIRCEVADIRDLEYTDGKLVSRKTGTAFNAVYRRAVTRDIMDHREEVRPFLQAVRENAVVLIGAMQTQLIHHKEIFKILHNPIMQKYFTPQQVTFIERHVPETMDLTEEAAQMAATDKDHWIIKPKDSYAARGVYAGVDHTQEEWELVLRDHQNADYILQQYIPPYKTKNIDLINYDTFLPYSNLTGLYAYNGTFAGVYSRMSDSGIISTQYNEKTVPTLFLKDSQDSRAD